MTDYAALWIVGASFAAGFLYGALFIAWWPW